MICTKCNKGSNLRDRGREKKCPHCGQLFVFEPAGLAGDPITDRLFLKAIQAVSCEGSVHWNLDHLRYELVRRKLPKLHNQLILLGAILCLSCVTGAGLFAIELSLAIIFGIGVFAGLIVVFLFHVSYGKYARYERFQVEVWLSRWEAVHGTPPGYIIRIPPQIDAPQPENDVADYSFDRAVICDRSETADVLLANHFHFENNCAVLSIDGYPPGPFEIVRRMLRRNPKLKVYALHDATVEGCELAERLATDPAWFGGGVPVIDVGLRPSHAQRLKGLWLRAAGPMQETTSAVTARELKWLKKNKLELAVIAPEQLIKRLYRAISQDVDTSRPEPRVIYLANRWLTKSEQAEIGGGNVYIDGAASSFGDTANDMDGLSDSFG
jgi:hypothetical protein